MIDTCWISIDPGLGGTGLAVWSHRMSTISSKPAAKLIKTAVFKSAGRKGELDWHEESLKRGQDVAYFMGNALLEPTQMYYELPAFMGGPTARRGDLVKLTITAGIIAGVMATAFTDITITPVPVIQWKGNLPKKLCCDRIVKLMGCAPGKYSEHELDAIGIGLHIQGVKI